MHHQIVRNGWTHPDPLRATEEVIGPAIGGMLVMILLPAGLLALARRFSFVLVNDKFLREFLSLILPATVH